MNVEGHSPFADKRIQGYLEHYKFGIIQQSNLYTELKDTVIVRDMSETEFAIFSQGLSNQGMEMEITKLQ
jgi:hypothetical protein